MTFEEIAKRAQEAASLAAHNQHHTPTVAESVSWLSLVVSDLATKLAEQERAQPGASSVYGFTVEEDPSREHGMRVWPERIVGQAVVTGTEDPRIALLRDKVNTLEATVCKERQLRVSATDEWDKSRKECLAWERATSYSCPEGAASLRKDRDEWKARAEKAERTAEEMAQKLAGEMQALVARAETAESALKECRERPVLCEIIELEKKLARAERERDELVMLAQDIATQDKRSEGKPCSVCGFSGRNGVHLSTCPIEKIARIIGKAT